MLKQLDCLHRESGRNSQMLADQIVEEKTAYQMEVEEYAERRKACAEDSGVNK